LVTNRKTRDGVEANLAKLRNNRAKLTRDISAFEDNVATLGVAIDAMGMTTKQQLQERENRLLREVADLARGVQGLPDDLQIARAIVADRKVLMESNVADVAAKEATV
jgi:hypothetical protein